MNSPDVHDMCGHHVGVRQKTHFLAEGKKNRDNVLMLCSMCVKLGERV